MSLASAYPSSNLSPVQFALMAIVVLGGLTAWLVLVYLAERPRRQRSRTREVKDPTTPGQAAAPDRIAAASAPAVPPPPAAFTPAEGPLKAAAGSESGS